MTAQLTRCHVCHVFITRLVTCNTCDILATLIVVTLSTLFKHRGKDKLNTWKMPPLKLGFTGEREISRRYHQDTESAQTEFPEVFMWKLMAGYRHVIGVM